MNLKQLMNEFMGVEDEEDFVGSTADFFYNNLVDIEYFIKRNSTKKAILKNGVSSHHKLSEFLFTLGISTSTGLPLSVGAVRRYLCIARKKSSVKPKGKVVEVQQEAVIKPVEAPMVEVKVDTPKPVVEAPKKFLKKTFENLKQEGWTEDKAVATIHNIYKDWVLTFKPIAWTQELEDAKNTYIYEKVNGDIRKLKDIGFYEFNSHISIKDFLWFLEKNKQLN